tara:strand:+ start:1884 stop:2297 length:414 start_codon:yes stop_codon:yes gene_type:complete
MGTAQRYEIVSQVNTQISQITGITDPDLVIDSNIAASRSIQQVLITNNGSATVYLKIWDLAFGSAPTISGSAPNEVWSAHPDMILPCAANEVADYTFLGEDQYVFANGTIINVGQEAGTGADSSGTVSVEVTIFSNS